MHFCPECQNMLYLKVSEGDGNNLMQYCRHGGHEDASVTESDVCVLSTKIKRSEEKYAHVINEFTKDDPTLPRTTTIRCPNSGCASNKDGEERDVLYLRYDDSNLQYVYLCAKCDTVWKTSTQV